MKVAGFFIAMLALTTGWVAPATGGTSTYDYPDPRYETCWQLYDRFNQMMADGSLSSEGVVPLSIWDLVETDRSDMSLICQGDAIWSDRVEWPAGLELRIVPDGWLLFYFTP